MDELLLARILALRTKADAINAELISMSTENQIRQDDGKAFAYGPKDFQVKSDDLQGISVELYQIGRGY